MATRTVTRTSIFDLSPERRAKGLALSFEKNDIATQGHANPDHWYVTSSTEEGHRYTVDTTHGTCECKAFAYYGYCRHLIRVSWELHQQEKRQRATALAVAA